MSQPPIPPLPIFDAGVPAADVPSTAPTLTAAELDILGRPQLPPVNIPPTDFKAWLDKTRIMTEPFALFADIIADILIGLLKVDEKFTLAWQGLELELIDRLLPRVMEIDIHEHQILIELLQQAFGAPAGSGVQFGSGSLKDTAQALFNQMVQPFTLMQSGLNPAERGSGIHAQQYLLSTALNLQLQQKVIDDVGQHMGLGLLKTLSPYMSIIDRSVNPSNVVRHAMNASLSFFLGAPMTRDLNRRYPIKDLGLTALARLHIRGAIDEQTYLDRCLDTGLDTNQAQQLILETARLLDPGAIAKLLNMGYLTAPDAKKLLAQLGYQPAAVDAQLYLDTHARYFQLQERVGTEAVTAWKHKYITTQRLREILKLTGYTDDEIQLLLIEGEFVKQTTTKDHITYAQIRAMFQANIIGIDDVIAFLEAKDYTPDEVIDLVLLDFTEAAERAARRNTLQARLRLSAEEDLVAADAAEAKDHADLAEARRNLASELKAEADTLGQPIERAGILQLLRI